MPSQSFPSEVDVVFNARTTTATPDATIMTKDAVIAEVGDANEEDLQPSSPEPKKQKNVSVPLLQTLQIIFG